MKRTGYEPHGDMGSKTFRLEPLEPRLLLSADGVAGAGAAPEHVRSSDVVIEESAVQDASQIQADLRFDASSDLFAGTGDLSEAVEATPIDTGFGGMDPVATGEIAPQISEPRVSQAAAGSRNLSDATVPAHLDGANQDKTVEGVLTLKASQGPPAEEGTLYYAAEAGKNELLLRLNPENGLYLELFDTLAGETKAEILVANALKVVLNGTDFGDDTLSVDFSRPFWLEEGIQYEGGDGWFDSLSFEAESSVRVDYEAIGSDAGRFQFTEGSHSMGLAFTGLEPVSFTGLGTFTFNVSNLPDNVSLQTPSGPGDLFIAGTSAFIPFETITLDNIGTIIVNGQDGQDTIHVDSALDLGSSNLDLAAETITIGSGNGITTTGDITLTAADSLDIGATDIALLLNELAADVNNDLSIDQILLDLLTSDATARIVLTGAELHADDITLSATATLTGEITEILHNDVDLDKNIPGFTLAIANVKGEAEIVLDGGTYEADGNLALTARTDAIVKSTARASASNSDPDFDGAVALAAVDTLAEASIKGTAGGSGTALVSVAGALSMRAINATSITTLADGTTGGNSATGGSVAIALVDSAARATISGDAVVGDTAHSAIDAAPASILLEARNTTLADTDAKATAKGANSNSPSAQGQMNANGAGTSGGNINVAGALAFNDVEATTRSALSASGKVVTGGNLTLNVFSDTDSDVTADASQVGAGSAPNGVGVAVAINLVDMVDDASLGNQVVAGDAVVSVRANTDRTGDGATSDDPDGVSTVKSTAISGVGTSNVGVAGAFALNIVGGHGAAVVESGAVAQIAANLNVNAAAAVASHAEATSRTGAPGSDTGIGASVALNIVDLGTSAEVEDGAALINVDDLDLTATTTPKVETKASAGATGGSTGLGGSFAIAIADTATKARLGTHGSATSLGGTVEIAASQENGTVETTADGTAADASSVGIGASLALTLGSDRSEARIDRALTAAGAGASAIGAKTVASRKSVAKASAKGAEKTSDASKDEANEQTSAVRNHAKGKAGTTGDKSKATPDMSSSEGPVGVAAAIGVTVSDVEALAVVGRNLTAGGTVAIRSSVNADSIAQADGSASGPLSVGVGAAVAVNSADMRNRALVSGSAVITSAGLTLTANMAARPGESVAAHDTQARSISGASGKTVGVAGSFTLNIVEYDTEAVLTGGTTVVNGNLALASAAVLKGDSSAKAKTSAPGADAGVGASVALTLADVETVSRVEEGATLANVQNLTLTAATSPVLTTLAEAGAGGSDVTVGGAVAITTANFRTLAEVQGAAGTTVLGGVLDVEAAQIDGSVTTTADGAVAEAADVGVGAAIALTFGSDTVKSMVKRSLTSAGSAQSLVSATSVAKRESIAKASAQGAEPKPGAETSDKQVEKEKTKVEQKKQTIRKEVPKEETFGLILNQVHFRTGQSVIENAQEFSPFAGHNVTVTGADDFDGMFSELKAAIEAKAAEMGITDFSQLKLTATLNPGISAVGQSTGHQNHDNGKQQFNLDANRLASVKTRLVQELKLAFPELVLDLTDGPTILGVNNVAGSPGALGEQNVSVNALKLSGKKIVVEEVPGNPVEKPEKVEEEKKTPKAETSKGAVGVAAAIAVTLSDVHAEAAVLEDLD
ncbi:MAG TPA: LEPR-XLL domain-containing protein, partial [Fibrobacteria bacterium]|nr:LEPR-XLL domain-containing protein [Fibrobacteria bacterium]